MGLTPWGGRCAGGGDDLAFGVAGREVLQSFGGVVQGECAVQQNPQVGVDHVHHGTESSRVRGVEEELGSEPAGGRTFDVGGHRHRDGLALLLSGYTLFAQQRRQTLADRRADVTVTLHWLSVRAKVAIVNKGTYEAG